METDFLLSIGIILLVLIVSAIIIAVRKHMDKKDMLNFDSTYNNKIF